MRAYVLSSVQPRQGLRIIFVKLWQPYPSSDIYKQDYHIAGTKEWEWFVEWGTVEWGENPGDLEFRVKDTTFSKVRDGKSPKICEFYESRRFRWSKTSERVIDEKMKQCEDNEVELQKFAPGDIARWQLKQKKTKAQRRAL